jgi:hypothetical protein
MVAADHINDQQRRPHFNGHEHEWSTTLCAERYSRSVLRGSGGAGAFVRRHGEFHAGAGDDGLDMKEHASCSI